MCSGIKFKPGTPKPSQLNGTVEWSCLSSQLKELSTCRKEQNRKGVQARMNAVNRWLRNDVDRLPRQIFCPRFDPPSSHWFGQALDVSLRRGR